MCEYCEGSKPLYEYRDDFCKIDNGLMVAKVMAMGMLFGSPEMINYGFSVSINYCPMCGRDLRE